MEILMKNSRKREKKQQRLSCEIFFSFSAAEIIFFLLRAQLPHLWLSMAEREEMKLYTRSFVLPAAAISRLFLANWWNTRKKYHTYNFPLLN
jgi:hypothetical protein